MIKFVVFIAFIVTAVFCLDFKPTPKVLEKPKWFSVTHRSNFAKSFVKDVTLGETLHSSKISIQLTGGILTEARFFAPITIGSQNFELQIDTGLNLRFSQKLLRNHLSDFFFWFFKGSTSLAVFSVQCSTCKNISDLYNGTTNYLACSQNVRKFLL